VRCLRMLLDLHVPDELMRIQGMIIRSNEINVIP
jgi:hypothetical protein